MNAKKIQIDIEDGFYCITYWFYDEKIGYLSIIRDDFEDPGLIYIEHTDQIFGFKASGIEFKMAENEISLTIIGNERFKFNNSSIFTFSLPENEIEKMVEVLRKMTPQALTKL